MKYKNGQLIEVMWDDFESDVEYVKGHVTIEQATKAYEEYWGMDSLNVCEIKHKFARWVPASHWSDFSMLFYVLDEKKRGSFPITELQLRKASEK